MMGHLVKDEHDNPDMKTDMLHTRGPALSPGLKVGF